MRYDFIIAGGGCAGLSLLDALLDSSLRNKKIAVIDKELKVANDRTWCFWSDSPKEYPYTLSGSWKNMALHTHSASIKKTLRKHQYNCLLSEDFYKPIIEKARQFENVDFILADIIEVKEGNEHATVVTNLGSYHATQVFNSLWKKNSFAGKFFLWQNFFGAFVRTQKPVFNTDSIRLMDFRISQENETQFFYVLPFSETFALVELTKFETQTSDFKHFQSPIENYIQQHWHLQINDYSVERTEQGRIPMTDADFSACLSPHIFPIGTAGGNTKPTTGYTFKRIQAESKRIVNALRANKPLTFRARGKRFQFYDHLLLSILTEKPRLASDIFLSLFKNNDASKVVRFLEEETTLLEEISLISQLPWSPFLEALWKEYVIADSRLENQLTFPITPSL